MGMLLFRWTLTPTRRGLDLGHPLQGAPLAF